MCDTIPKPGMIRIYTSGCPKNQKRCWYSNGSPPPAASKNEVLKFLSVSSIVRAPASTGKDSSSRVAVTNTAQQNKGSLCKVIPGFFMLRIVVMKLVAPSREEIPAKCRLKIARSTEPPECDCKVERGG